MCHHKRLHFVITFAHALGSIRPQLSNTATEIIYAEQSELLSSLRLTLLGVTSNLHVWDPRQERFILKGAHQGENGMLSIICKDETITYRLASFVPNIVWP